MKFNKWLLIGLFLFAVVSLGAVSANENVTQETAEQNAEDVYCTLQVNEAGEDVQASIDEDDLTASDNVTVEVSDVFEGQNATVSVKVAEATGTVNITVGEDFYTPEFIGGVATQSISKYSIGLNNVTIKYNNVIKQTSFKVLDGVITNDTFDDYFEVSDRYYYLRSFIPEGITLDFRGLIERNYMITGDTRYVSLTKPYNITSTTGDGVIDIQLFNIESGAVGSNVSNIKTNQLTVYASYFSAINFTGSLYYAMDNGTDFKIIDSKIDSLRIGHVGVRRIDNVLIVNCTVNSYYGYQIYYMNNVSVFNSTFNSGFSLVCSYSSYRSVTNITIKNCILNGLTLRTVQNALVENCTFRDEMNFNYIKDVTVRNNFINASSSTYAINLGGNGDIDSKFIGNRIYSKYYCGDRAIAYQHSYDIYFWPDTNNVFENNTPTQTDLNIGFTADTILYDENTTVVVNMPGIEGNVTFYFNGKKISTVKLADGIATQTIYKCELGINNVSAVYEDLVKDIWGINHTSFKVNKVGHCPVNLVYDDIIEGKFSTVNVVLPDDANGTITFTLSNSTHSITIKRDANGANNIFNVLALLKGNYTMSATFESVKYVINSTSANISVVHVPVYKLTASDVVMDYKDGSKYKVLVTKDGKAALDETVKITFNGKTTDVKTDKKGYATLTLDAGPKIYTIKAVCNGVTKTSKVTIKSVLKAKNVSKKKAKTIKFSATLKTSKGKAISGKKITFKLKGKNYSAKTNKKGVATITIKNLKVGKYTITSKYGACAVKSTLTIRK